MGREGLGKCLSFRDKEETCEGPGVAGSILGRWVGWEVESPRGVFQTV